MKKLRLDLDQLIVETFDTREADASKKGTVRGAEVEPAPLSWDESCESCQSACGSCDYSCTCPYTFDGHLVDTNRSCVYACPVCWI